MIDKDYAASTLARDLKADLFLITTAVDKVALNFGKPDQQLLDTLTHAQAKEYLAQGHFQKGSMGPKVQAIIWYLEAGGKEALITTPENIEHALAGETGTRSFREGVTRCHCAPGMTVAGSVWRRFGAQYS